MTEEVEVWLRVYLDANKRGKPFPGDNAEDAVGRYRMLFATKPQEPAGAAQTPEPPVSTLSENSPVVGPGNGLMDDFLARFEQARSWTTDDSFRELGKIAIAELKRLYRAGSATPALNPSEKLHPQQKFKFGESVSSSDKQFVVKKIRQVPDGRYAYGHRGLSDTDMIFEENLSRV